MPNKKAPVILLALTLLLGRCAYTGKSRTFVPILEQTRVSEIQQGLEGIIKSNPQAIHELEQRQKKQWLRFVIVGDTLSNHNLTYRNLLAKISRLDPLPEFIVNLGDFTEGKSEQYSYYFDTIKNYSHPIIHVTGNHEIENGGKRISRAVFGKTDFSFDYNDVRLIFMGSESQGLTGQRLEWLEDKLKDDYPAKKIFLSHKFPVEPFKELFSGVYSLFVHKRKNEEKLLDLLDNYDVPLAFFGHLHRYYAKTHRGTVMIITGGGGQRSSLEPKAKQPLSTKKKHFTVVDLLTKEGEQPQGVTTCINRYSEPLFMNSFYMGGSNGNGQGPDGNDDKTNGNNYEPSIQLVPYSPSDNNMMHPPYLEGLYNAYVRKNSSKKKIGER